MVKPQRTALSVALSHPNVNRMEQQMPRPQLRLGRAWQHSPLMLGVTRRAKVHREFLDRPIQNFVFWSWLGCHETPKPWERGPSLQTVPAKMKPIRHRTAVFFFVYASSYRFDVPKQQLYISSLFQGVHAAIFFPRF